MSKTPAQSLMGRSIKTLLPSTKTLLMPKTTQAKIAKNQLKECQQAQAKCYNWTAKDSQKLSEGDIVRMKLFKLGAKSWQKAQVTARLEERSCTVEAKNRTVNWRNRQNLEKTPVTNSAHSIWSSRWPYHSQLYPSIPTLTEEPVDKPLASTSDEGSTNQHLRPQGNRRPPAYLKDHDCSWITISI